jgi:hypothetical protein
MKRYKYQALVTLLPDDGGAPPVLPAATTRMVIKAEHRKTHASKMFSSLVTHRRHRPRGPARLPTARCALLSAPVNPPVTAAPADRRRTPDA